METFLHDLRYGVRVLFRTPGFTAVAVLVLALGIGANSAIFSVINSVLLRPLPFREPERLIQVHASQTQLIFVQSLLAFLIRWELPLLKGRGFTEQDDGREPKAVLISQRMVEKYWSGKNPIVQGINTSSISWLWDVFPLRIFPHAETSMARVTRTVPRSGSTFTSMN